VTVYKLVTEGTVDARILELGRQKSEVNRALLDDDGEGESGAGGGKSEASSMSRMLKDALKAFLS
jgi:SNF2 family DNA or RNA helicase